MRKFRNAALAVATATTVAISGVSVASAQDNGETVTLSDNSTLSKIRKGLDPENKLQWDQPTKGENIFGKENWKNNKEISANTPLWAKVADSLLITTAAISVFGLVVAPIYNFLRYGINR
ncbi:hypothetical protein [Corynebacterium jeikeium]|uniref:hypothetical protein n=1 Tax=Corynebacterium jeikeium TaxID=38289 RepID=UPI000886ED4E|nr:hypothetical protein [Corynebacterium jeikeium]SCX01329.1 hypothetical protein CJBVI_0149 [Corynebacterium jeikeium]